MLIRPTLARDVLARGSIRAVAYRDEALWTPAGKGGADSREHNEEAMCGSPV